MGRQTIISDSQTPLFIRVIGGMLILVGIYGVIYNVLFMLTGVVSFKYIFLTALSFFVGWGVIKMRKWTLYALSALFLATLYHVYYELNSGTVVSIYLFVLPTVALAATIYCWGKKGLFS